MEVPRRLALGTPVAFHAQYVRRAVDTTPDAPKQEWDWTNGRIQDLWVRIATPNRSGILVGYRTRCNGWTDRSDREEGPRWVHTGSVRCALVVESLYRNPVEVPLEDMREVLMPLAESCTPIRPERCVEVPTGSGRFYKVDSTWKGGSLIRYDELEELRRDEADDRLARKQAEATGACTPEGCANPLCQRCNPADEGSE